MPLFVAQLRHPPETCSAVLTGSGLLSRVSAAAAARHTVSIEAEALIVLVVEAANRRAVEDFLAFLHQDGELEVLPASTVEEAAERGGCSAEPIPDGERRTQTQGALRRAEQEGIR